MCTLSWSNCSRSVKQYAFGKPHNSILCPPKPTMYADHVYLSQQGSSRPVTKISCVYSSASTTVHMLYIKLRDRLGDDATYALLPAAMAHAAQPEFCESLSIGDGRPEQEGLSTKFCDAWRRKPMWQTLLLPTPCCQNRQCTTPTASTKCSF